MISGNRNPWKLQFHEIKSRFYNEQDKLKKKKVRPQTIQQQPTQVTEVVDEESGSMWQKWNKSLKTNGGFFSK